MMELVCGALLVILIVTSLAWRVAQFIVSYTNPSNTFFDDGY